MNKLEGGWLKKNYQFVDIVTGDYCKVFDIWNGYVYYLRDVATRENIFQFIDKRNRSQYVDIDPKYKLWLTGFAITNQYIPRASAIYISFSYN